MAVDVALISAPLIFHDANAEGKLVSGFPFLSIQPTLSKW